MSVPLSLPIMSTSTSISPTKVHSGTVPVQHLSDISLAKGLRTREFRSEFKKELLNTIVHGKHAVFEKLVKTVGALSSDDSLMDVICAAVRKDCDAAIQELLALAAEADKGRKDAEADMYAPLNKIMEGVESALAQPHLDLPRKCFRRPVLTSSHSLAKEATSYGVEQKPDFVIVEVPPPTRGKLHEPVTDDYATWSRCPSFIEVKAKTGDIPRNRRSNNTTGTLTQAADYARVIMIARPFQLYVYGLLFCGHSFVLALFDRRGVVVSKDYSIKSLEGLKNLICILFTMWSDTRSWTTFGPPIWTYPSLLGRGTSVWRTFAPDGRAMVVKMAWRTENRMSESDIYQEIARIYNSRLDELPRGMAQFYEGRDVMYLGERISVYRLREPVNPYGPPKVGDEPAPRGFSAHLRVSQDEPNAFLHRVTFADTGKPLWEYTDISQLAKVLYMVIYAHKDLCQHGIIHRDISVGNVLIRTDVSITTNATGEQTVTVTDHDPPEGFLTDFELAKIATLVKCETYLPPEGSTKLELQKNTNEAPAAKVGDTITGTALFMATSLLQEISRAREEGQQTITLARGEEHDIESFYWVIFFVLYKRALLNERLKKKGENYQSLNREFCSLYTAKSTGHLADERSRRLREPGYKGIQVLRHYLQVFESEPLIRFVEALWKSLRSFLPGSQEGDEPNKDRFERSYKVAVMEYLEAGVTPPTREEVFRLVGSQTPTPQTTPTHGYALMAVRILLEDIGETDWLDEFLAEEKKRKARAENLRKLRKKAERTATREAKKQAKRKAKKDSERAVNEEAA
ncbi:hypothetical protein BD413DRAFT_681596 [Trametes elegans]|nr:hypothetical protein BD413DRAFT_681596 [Trametes elegans]